MEWKLCFIQNLSFNMSKLGSLLIAPQIKLEQFAYLFYDYLQNNWIGFKYSPYVL